MPAISPGDESSLAVAPRISLQKNQRPRGGMLREGPERGRAVTGRLRRKRRERLEAAVGAVAAERRHADLAVLVGLLMPAAADRRLAQEPVERGFVLPQAHRHLAPGVDRPDREALVVESAHEDVPAEQQPADRGQPAARDEQAPGGNARGAKSEDVRRRDRHDRPS